MKKSDSKPEPVEQPSKHQEAYSPFGLDEDAVKSRSSGKSSGNSYNARMSRARGGRR